MNLFLDTSVVLAACGSLTGASRAIFDVTFDHGWSLLTSAYVLSEVAINLPALPNDARAHYSRLLHDLPFNELVEDA